jgi:hypothetical protein
MSWISTLAALGVAVGSTAPLSAQVGLASSPQSVRLSAIKQGWVRVSLPGGSSASLSRLVSGANDFPPVPVETSWNVDPGQTAAVTLVAHFAAPGRALAGAEGAIPASLVLGRLTGEAKGFVPVGGSLQLFTQPIAEPNATGARTDALEVRIDLTALPELPPATYTGTLNLVAVTQ